jgi:hypothetical protein
VIELEVERGRPAWPLEVAGVEAALAEHRGGGDGRATGGPLLEPDRPDALRAGLRAVAPTLAELADRVRAAFDDEHACAVVVPAGGLAGFDDDRRRTGAYALAALLGDPMANHPDDSVVWDVQDQQSVRVSHSTSSRAAGYHTDAGYLRTPPLFFMLYEMRAAACGGGESLIRDGRVVLDQLAGTDEGRAAIEVLRAPLPRRVPGRFHPVAFVADNGFQYSPVIADLPLWRWARKNIRIGLEADPDRATPEVRKALGAVDAILRDGDHELRPGLPTDSLIIVDNHITFHGRTAFTDQRRHLLRIRFHDPRARGGHS